MRSVIFVPWRVSLFPTCVRVKVFVTTCPSDRVRTDTTSLTPFSTRTSGKGDSYYTGYWITFSPEVHCKGRKVRHLSVRV